MQNSCKFWNDDDNDDQMGFHIKKKKQILSSLFIFTIEWMKTFMMAFQTSKMIQCDRKRSATGALWIETHIE